MTAENRLLTGDSEEAVALAASFGLPAKNLRSFKFELDAGDAAILTAVYYVSEDQAGIVAHVVKDVIAKKYVLTEIT